MCWQSLLVLKRMANSKVVIRNATTDEVERMVGKQGKTVRAVVGVMDGNVLGIGGIVYEDSYIKAFMDITEEGKLCKKSLAKATKMVLEMAKEKNLKLIAVADDTDIAPQFLEHFGFKFSHDTDIGPVYTWHN